MYEDGLHDPFTDQVECARFRAERDMLAQAMERVADDIERTFLGFEGAEDAPAMRWARQFRAALGSLHAPVRDMTMSAYDLLPEDERDAIAWVRDHGGLDAVKKLLDWVVGHCSTRQQLDFDFWLSGRVMHELGFDEDMADRDEVERRLLARLMPEGMEWPRFEDGEPVRPGDRLLDGDGDWFKAVSFMFTCDWWSIRGYQTEGFGDLNDKTRRTLEGMSYGERVKRPAPKVLDADGVEICVGDRVWSTHLDEPHEWIVIDSHGDRDDSQTVLVSIGDRSGHARPENLTHRAPVLAADGKPLREGETVWHVETGREYVVVEPSYGDTVVVRLAKYDDAEGEQYAPDQLTHEHPVLDADGVPIKKGDTVYVAPFDDPLTVRGFAADGRVLMDYHNDDSLGYKPSKLTHEQPDTWERIEEDAKLAPGDYIEKCGRKTDLYAYQEMPIDLVRRCHALAERERSE